MLTTPVNRPTRRTFLKRSILTASAATLVAPGSRVLGANKRLNVAAIGAGGKGAVDIGFCAGENVVALCDVDERNAAGTFKRFGSAQRFTDFRVMLEKLDKGIDAVTVSTPDHLHAVAAAMAIRLGKHVYCQKPLTHTIDEARHLTKLAREHGVVTQMGNQGHSQPDSRRLVEILRSGAVGKVRGIHIWTDRPIWPQGERAMAAFEAGKAAKAPKTMNWDLWLGPAAKRPYNSAYAPFKWRGFWPFGTGALGDMGCHNMDLAFFAYELRDPTRVMARSSRNFDITAPQWSEIMYDFPSEHGVNGNIKMVWYDGGRKPVPELVKLNDARQLPRNGTIVVGMKDTLFVPNFWGAGKFVRSGRTMANFQDVPETFPKVAGDNDRTHHLEWIAACKAGDPKAALSNFDYAGPMTEAVLLGNVALRAGKPIAWDAKAMKVTNDADANRFVNHDYRAGWSL